MFLFLLGFHRQPQKVEMILGVWVIEDYFQHETYLLLFQLTKDPQNIQNGSKHHRKVQIFVKFNFSRNFYRNDSNRLKKRPGDSTSPLDFIQT